MELKIFLLLNGIINSVMIEYFPFAVLQFKYKFNKYYAFAAIVLLDTIIILPRTIGDAGPSLLNTILTCGHPLIWSNILFKDSVWKKLATTVGFNIFVMLPLEFISMFIIHIFWGGNFFSDSYARNNIYYAGVTLNNLLYFSTLILIILLWRKLVDKKRSPQLPVYLAVAFYQSILLCLWLRIAVDYSSSTKWLGLLLEVFGFTIDMILFYYFNQMESKLETEEKLAALYRQRDFEQEYYRISQQNLAKMKDLNNEFTSHIRELQEAVKETDHEQNVRQILDISQVEINNARQTVYSLHPVINALLCVKSGLAKSRNIRMEIHCTHSAETGIEDIDICSVLGNLLDNSIEACEAIESKDKMITADISEKAGFFIVTVKNPINAKTSSFKGIGYTSKPDSENHGLGLRMVERICTKYDGRLLLAPSEDIISVSAILKKNKN